MDVFSPDGIFLRSLGTGEEGKLCNPGSVCVFNGEVYVSDDGRRGVFVYDKSSGAFVRQFTAPASNMYTRFVEPRGVSVVGGTDVWVCDRGANAIHIYSQDGTLLRSIPDEDTRSDSNYAMSSVESAMEWNGEVYVCDTACVRVFTREGRFVKRFGGVGSAHGKLLFSHVWVCLYCIFVIQ